MAAARTYMGEKRRMRFITVNSLWGLTTCKLPFSKGRSLKHSSIDARYLAQLFVGDGDRAPQPTAT